MTAEGTPEITSQISSNYNAIIVFSSGKFFFGRGIGKPGKAIGEICFNTGMTGYQEVLTDPSYAGQVINFTFPHIGNVGANGEDFESRKVWAAGLVVRAAMTDPSNFRAENHLNDWLDKEGITGISGVDTRAITRHIRISGAQNVGIYFADNIEGFNIAEFIAEVRAKPGLKGVDLASCVTAERPYEWSQGIWKLDGEASKCLASSAPLQEGSLKVVAIDYGEKLNILRCLNEAGCKVTVVPAKTTAEEILKLLPDGIFLSNGPADPAATGKYAVGELRKLIDSGVPIFGICLGHQLLALALGGQTEKMHQGHRGANHPVKNLETGKVEITSQNHGFVVTPESLPKNVKVTHLSLFDGTVEGMKVEGKPVFSVQYHPESSPGPHDSRYLFEKFVSLMKEFREEGSEARGQGSERTVYVG